MTKHSVKADQASEIAKQHRAILGDLRDEREQESADSTAQSIREEIEKIGIDKAVLLSSRTGCLIHQYRDSMEALKQRKFYLEQSRELYAIFKTQKYKDRAEWNQYVFDWNALSNRVLHHAFLKAGILELAIRPPCAILDPVSRGRAVR